jgi:DNA mismatch repair protein MutS
MAIFEKDGVITFLHRLQAGAAGQSYGIHVAKLAGLPLKVTDRAQEILREVEGTITAITESKRPANSVGEVERPRKTSSPQLPFSFEAPRPDPAVDVIVKELRTFDVNHSTPLEALIKISKWVQELQVRENH